MSLGLALSGGGSRAAAFHAGTLEGLAALSAYSGPNLQRLAARQREAREGVSLCATAWRRGL